MKRAIILAMLFTLVCASLVLATDVRYKRVEFKPDIPSFVGYVPNEVVVHFDNSVVSQLDRKAAPKGKLGIPALDRLGEKYGVTSIRQEFQGARREMVKGRVLDLSGWYKVKFADKVNVEAVVNEYKAIPGVIDAQPIGIHTVYATPNDGYYPDQWHLNQANDHDMDAPEAWDIETGDASVIIAILDTGVRYFHKDLGGSNASYDNPGGANGNMWINWAEKNGTSGVDDDGNGYVDDWVGWDFVDGGSNCWSGEDCSTEDNDPRDFNGHGTHCAGNVAAINNNGYATSAASGGWGDGSLQPTANGVKVMACRIGWSGRYWFWEVGYVRMDFAAEALYYAADNGAKIASCSWGSSNSGGIADAIDYFLAHGGIIFKAAGNDNSQTADYMCGRSDIVSVAATDSNDCKADFSDYGTWVDICAPGTGIWSLYHDHTDPQSDYVASLDGTSMATPLAASVAALIWSQNPSWSASQVEQQLYDSADDIDGLSCNSSYSGKLGAGRINAFNAVNIGPPPPVADFSASPTSGCAPLTVDFTDGSTGEIEAWDWDFGDGTSHSSEQNPSHIYNSAGDYTVSLTVTGPGGSDTETKTNYIHVDEAPTAAFVGDPSSGCAPLTVDFTDQSTGTVTTWDWDFGDGSAHSTGQNPTHKYTDPGNYTVTLTVSGPCGSDTEQKTDYIDVGPTLIADFSANPTSGCAPLTVDFTDQSTGEIDTWDWDFGDGSAHSSAQNPSHTYNSAGDYTVSLTITGSCGSDTETKTNYIEVEETPGADFVGEPTSGDAPLTVNFTDQSTNHPTSWSWDFGDGGSSTAQNPSHQYADPGTYTVSLTAGNGCGSDTETKTDYITVTQPSQNVMHVNAVDVTKESWWILVRGKARVQIVDAQGSPVEGATVTGEWSGGATDSDQFTTGSDGWGTAYSNWHWGDASFTFCVTDVSKDGWTYDPDANVVTCRSTDGSTSIAAAKVSQAGIGEVEGGPGQKLACNYPNPFNSTTEITFYLPRAAHISLEIYNTLGQKITTLMDGDVSAGVSSVTWDGRDGQGNSVASGIYLYRLTFNRRESLLNKMILLK